MTKHILGCKLENGFEVSPEYIGDRCIIEIAVAVPITDRSASGGTAKSWVSEHLAAAIAGDSTMLIQGTTGTSKEAIRYGWNYARLLARGPSMAALVPSLLMQAMQDGKTKIESPGGTLSTAEAIPVVNRMKLLGIIPTAALDEMHY